MRHNFATEFECEFCRFSRYTFKIHQKIRTMSHMNPIVSQNGLDMYEQPIKGRDYVITVDVARGTI